MKSVPPRAHNKIPLLQLSIPCQVFNALCSPRPFSPSSLRPFVPHLLLLYVDEESRLGWTGSDPDTTRRES